MSSSRRSSTSRKMLATDPTVKTSARLRYDAPTFEIYGHEKQRFTAFAIGYIRPEQSVPTQELPRYCGFTAALDSTVATEPPK